MKNLKLSKLIASTLVIASLLALSPIGVSAEWKQNSTGWWYTEGNSWSTGWRKIDSKWYYFDSNGYMKTGWLLDGGNWYYLYSNGKMAFNTKIDGYYLNDSGVWSQNSSGNINNVSNKASENGNAQIVTFPDKYLEQEIRRTIGKPTGDLYKSDVENITELAVNLIGGQGDSGAETVYIKDISGIENLTNLQYLELGPIQLSDLSEIKGLTNLQHLKLIALDESKIIDISAIVGLTNLQELELFRIKISDTDLQSLKNTIPKLSIR